MPSVYCQLLPLTLTGSAALLLQSKDLLAARVLALGGSPLSFSPMPVEAAEKIYMGVSKGRVENTSPTRRIETLSQASPEILLGQLDKTAQFLPVMDGDRVPYVPTFELAESRNTVPENTFCEAAIVGYAPFNVSYRQRTYSWRRLVEDDMCLTG